MFIKGDIKTQIKYVSEVLLLEKLTKIDYLNLQLFPGENTSFIII